VDMVRKINVQYNGVHCPNESANERLS